MASGQSMQQKAGISEQRKPHLRLQQEHRLAGLTLSATSFESRDSSSSPWITERVWARAPARFRDLLFPPSHNASQGGRNRIRVSSRMVAADVRRRVSARKT